MSGKFVGYRPGVIYMTFNVLFWIFKYTFSIFLTAPMLTLLIKYTCCSKEHKDEEDKELQKITTKHFEDN